MKQYDKCISTLILQPHLPNLCDGKTENLYIDYFTVPPLVSKGFPTFE
jgi:hypothetical protein